MLELNKSSFKGRLSKPKFFTSRWQWHRRVKNSNFRIEYLREILVKQWPKWVSILREKKILGVQISWHCLFHKIYINYQKKISEIIYTFKWFYFVFSFLFLPKNIFSLCRKYSGSDNRWRADRAESYDERWRERDARQISIILSQSRRIDKELNVEN